MTVETNINALRATPGFIESLLPDARLVQARGEFDRAGRNIDPGKFAQANRRINKANNLCARLVRQQYYPIIKKTTLAFMQDFKLSAQEMNKDEMYRHRPLDGQITYDTLFHITMDLLQTSIRGSNAFLHIANAIKPMILKALKELETERTIVVHRPRKSAFGKCAHYELAQ